MCIIDVASLSKLFLRSWIIKGYVRLEAKVFIPSWLSIKKLTYVGSLRLGNKSKSSSHFKTGNVYKSSIYNTRQKSVDLIHSLIIELSVKKLKSLWSGQILVSQPYSPTLIHKSAVKLILQDSVFYATYQIPDYLPLTIRPRYKQPSLTNSPVEFHWFNRSQIQDYIQCRVRCVQHIFARSQVAYG